MERGSRRSVGAWRFEPLAVLGGLVMAIAGLWGCRSPSVAGEPAPPLVAVTDEELARVVASRTYFGHQSVGDNALEGLRTLLLEKGAAWRVAEVPSGVPVDGAVLIHSRVGENGDPRSKIDDFARTVDALAGAPPRVAFMKLCYVDFAPETDVRAVFDHYRATLTALRQRHPGIVFGHATVPLQTRGSGLGDSLRRFVGKPTWGDYANLRREEYNQLMRSEFAREPLLDIASVESTTPAGAREAFQVDGRTAYALVGAYSDDGGHLNPVGQRRVAEALLRFLTTALAAPPSSEAGTP